MVRVLGVLTVAFAITSTAAAGKEGRLINHMTKQEYFGAGQALVLPDRTFESELQNGLVCVDGSAKAVAKSLKVDNQASQSEKKRTKVKAKGDGVVISYEQAVCKEFGPGYQDDPGDCLKTEDKMLSLEIPSCQSKEGNVYFEKAAFNEKQLTLKGWLFIPQLTKSIKGDYVKNGTVRTFVMGPTKVAIQLRSEESEFDLGTAWIDSTVHKQAVSGKSVELGRECKVAPGTSSAEARVTCGVNTVLIPIELLKGQVPAGAEVLRLERKRNYDLKVDSWSMKQTRATLRQTLALAGEYKPELIGDAAEFCGDIRRVLGNEKGIAAWIKGSDDGLSTASDWTIDSKTGNVVGTKTVKCLESKETDDGSYCQVWDVKEVARIPVDCRQ